jgi:hypothetical protein
MDVTGLCKKPNTFAFQKTESLSATFDPNPLKIARMSKAVLEAEELSSCMFHSLKGGQFITSDLKQLLFADMNIQGSESYVKGFLLTHEGLAISYKGSGPQRVIIIATKIKVIIPEGLAARCNSISRT